MTEMHLDSFAVSNIGARNSVLRSAAFSLCKQPRHSVHFVYGPGHRLRGTKLLIPHRLGCTLVNGLLIAQYWMLFKTTTEDQKVMSNEKQKDRTQDNTELSDERLDEASGGGDASVHVKGNSIKSVDDIQLGPSVSGSSGGGDSVPMDSFSLSEGESSKTDPTKVDGRSG